MLDDAQAVATSLEPTKDWPGFSFKGFDNVKACTLLSLLKSGRPYVEFEHYLDRVLPLDVVDEEGPVVCPIHPDQVAELAAIASLEDVAFENLATSWAATDEFAMWAGSDVRFLLRELGDLAESATLEGKCLFIWQLP